MRYVVGGYVFILVVLFLYAVQLVWRRRRLARAVSQVAHVAQVSPVAAPAPPVPLGATAGRSIDAVPIAEDPT